MLGKLSAGNRIFILFTQVMPWLILFAINITRPSVLESIGPYLNNKPAAIIISFLLAIIIGFIILIDSIINGILLKKINSAKIKFNLLVSCIHIIAVFITIVALYGGEDL